MTGSLNVTGLPKLRDRPNRSWVTDFLTPSILAIKPRAALDPFGETNVVL
jgi:hypothetical protein